MELVSLPYLYAFLFIVAWAVALNTPWFTGPRFSLLGHFGPFKRNGYLFQSAEWLVRTAIVFGAAYSLDRNINEVPHSGYDSPALFVLFICISAVLALPGVLYFSLNKRK